MPECQELVAIPRKAPLPVGPLPKGLRYLVEATGSKLRYLSTVVRTLLTGGRFQAILCTHINLLPIATLARWWLRAPVVLVIYGVDAWTPPPFWTRAALRRVDSVISISEVTLDRFLSWSSFDPARCRILPNAIHLDWYGSGTPNPRLVSRYRLEGKTVIMTLGRLESEKRRKGFDEVIEVLPELAAEFPDLTYLIAGYGADQERLKRKAEDLGVAERVRFTGPVREDEKAEHYRLAHAFVMPSRGEGFGFVLLEALACGIPVVASRQDGGREAIRDGELGILVDPTDLEDVKRGIRSALARGRGCVPPGLSVYSFPTFRQRAGDLLREATAR
jgi:glycosyltransferase involved in cell wall biosynthesis